MIAATDGRTACPPNVDFARMLDIVRGEYREMPGLRLTERQAQRLWSLDTATCDAVLGTLESAHFLCRSRNGAYMLAVHD